MAQRPKRRPSNPFSTIIPHAAGIDIGATHHVVAVSPGQATASQWALVREFQVLLPEATVTLRVHS